MFSGQLLGSCQQHSTEGLHFSACISLVLHLDKALSRQVHNGTYDKGMFGSHGTISKHQIRYLVYLICSCFNMGYEL